MPPRPLAGLDAAQRPRVSKHLYRQDYLEGDHLADGQPCFVADSASYHIILKIAEASSSNKADTGESWQEYL
jgi:hypothetical protein